MCCPKFNLNFFSSKLLILFQIETRSVFFDAIILIKCLRRFCVDHLLDVDGVGVFCVRQVCIALNSSKF